MTREEYIARLSAIEAEVHTKVQDYNAAYGEKKYDEAAAINTETEKLIAEYADVSQLLCFDACCNTPDPMIEACLRLSFPVIDVRDVAEGDAEVKILKRVVIEDKVKKIDPLKLNKYAKGRGLPEIGHDPKWNFMLERLNLLFSLDCAVRIGKGQEFIQEMHDVYAIKEASREIDFGVKDPTAGTPISSTGLLKAVSATVSAMIGEDFGKKTLTHDVRFLKIVAAKKSKNALAVQCANARAMRGYLMEVCNRILTDGVYDVEYKRVKGK